MIRVIDYRGKQYTIRAWNEDNSCIEIGRDGKKKLVDVKDNSEFTYRLMKTAIVAKDGAKGLFNFIRYCFDNNLMICLAEKVINWAVDQMREAK